MGGKLGARLKLDQKPVLPNLQATASEASMKSSSGETENQEEAACNTRFIRLSLELTKLAKTFDTSWNYVHLCNLHSDDRGMFG